MNKYLQAVLAWSFLLLANAPAAWANGAGNFLKIIKPCGPDPGQGGLFWLLIVIILILTIILMWLKINKLRRELRHLG